MCLQVRVNVPSFCDRVLWRSYPGTYIVNLAYGRCVCGICLCVAVLEIRIRNLSVSFKNIGGI